MKLLKWFGIALATLAAKSNKKTPELAKALGMPEADLDKFFKGEAELGIEAGGLDEIAEAVGSTSGEVTEAAMTLQAEAEAKAADDKKKADDEAAAKKAADDDKAIKDAKKTNAKKSFSISVPDNGNISKSHKGDADDADRNETRKTGIISTVSKGLFSAAAREQLSKGIIPQGFISPGDVLTPEQSQGILSLLSDRSQFLSKVQRVNMRSTKQDVSVWDISGRKMKRLKSGFYPANDANASSIVNKSISLTAHKVNLEIMISDESIVAHRNNWAQMESDIVNGFAMHMGNEILDLLMNGQEDGTASEELTWTELLKGWLVKADEGVPIGNKLSYATEGATVPKDMWNEAILTAAPNRRFFGDAEFIIAGEDWEKHEEDLLTRTDATPFLINGAPMKYRNRTVNSIDYLDEKFGFYCNPKNLVAGFVTGGEQGFGFKSYGVPDGIYIRFTGYLATGFVNVDEGIILLQD